MFKCRLCGKPLTDVFVDLGHQPPSNALLTKEDLEKPETYYPLKVYICSSCFLVQLPELAKAEQIFNSDYVYYSSESPANVAHAKAFVDIMMDRFKPKSVLEVGSNDGYLLQHFPETVKVRGVEPSYGPAKVAVAKGVPTYIEFFNKTFAEKLNIKVDLLCGINTLAHQPNLNEAIASMRTVLEPDGVVVQEFPYLVNLIQKNQFDTIYHEHYSYFSFNVLFDLFEAHELTIFDVEQIPEHGGSLRIYARRMQCGKYPVLRRVSDLLQKEIDSGINDLKYYQGFQEQVDLVRDNLRTWLYLLNHTGLVILAYGGAAKGATLLNYCGAQAHQLPFIVDRSPYKQGKSFPGCHIPIVDESVIRKMKPSYVLILPWNLKEEIRQQLSYIKEWGGHFLVPIPQVEVL